MRLPGQPGAAPQSSDTFGNRTVSRGGETPGFAAPPRGGCAFVGWGIPGPAVAAPHVPH
jgi:hypothetical protein